MTRAATVVRRSALEVDEVSVPRPQAAVIIGGRRYPGDAVRQSVEVDDDGRFISVVGLAVIVFLVFLIFLVLIFLVLRFFRRPVLGVLLGLFVLQLGLNTGIRPLFWVLVPELFPLRFRIPGQSEMGRWKTQT
ncbi:MAG: hypothetical protein AAF368_19010 [Planctomycetota bacterium]